MIARWDSITDFVRFARTHATLSTHSEGRSWDAGVTGVQAAELAIAGDRSIVAQCMTDVDAFTLGATEETRPQWESSVAGSRVDVPSFIAGSPACMKRRAKRATDTRHVAIYVSTSCGANIPASVMLKRGAAILGLLETLQASGVAVDLFVVDDMQGARSEDRVNPSVLHEAKRHGTWDLSWNGDHVQVIRVESRPLDLSVAGFALAHPAFARNVALAVGAPFGFSGQWSETYMRTRYDAPAYRKAMARTLGMSPSDLFVPPVDNRDTVVQDPARWMRECLAQVMGGAAA